MDKDLIDLNVERAITEINSNFNFCNARIYIEKALDEVGSNKKLAYYDVLRNVITKLHYYVRGISKKIKVRECYSSMLHYYQAEFEKISSAEINPDSEIEMNICNSICCGIINSMSSFVNSMRSLYFDAGLFTALANNSKYLNEYMPLLLKCERAACDVLKRFNCKSAQIEQNIETWDGEVRGKYGAKYL